MVVGVLLGVWVGGGVVLGLWRVWAWDGPLCLVCVAGWLVLRGWLVFDCGGLVWLLEAIGLPDGHPNQTRVWKVQL